MCRRVHLSYTYNVKLFFNLQILLTRLLKKKQITYNLVQNCYNDCSRFPERTLKLFSSIMYDLHF